jgi:predicted ATPase/class 3 adenylate cyclase
MRAVGLVEHFEGIPEGTVTFLFSDIQGSTRLWELHAAKMSPALARHDELVREVIEAHDGYVFKTVGDAFCAAFHTATNALSAAVETQRVLDAEEWNETPLKVRMALHTGSAQSRGGDYFGQPLNRVARLLSAGHGGQILLSLATEELVRDNLPDDISLRDMGDRRLKDLVRPERVFQVVGPELASDFPPLKTLDTLANNFPIQLTSFVGREQEMFEIKDLLQTSHILTLTGSGGAGKTRLSQQVAADLIENFPDGAWLVELAALTEPIQVERSVAQVLGVQEEPNTRLIDSMVRAIREKKLLVILDNCEHLLDACAAVVDAMSHSCPKIQFLCTSREPLGIAGERTYRVPSLGLPPVHSSPIGSASDSSLLGTDDGRSITASELTQYESVRLFIERATLSNAQFTVTNENAPAVAHLCVRLDGIPLALELAAASCRAMSVQEIHARLDNRFKLLTGGSRTALPRQKTLRALVDWSYDLLNDSERMLLMRLSVFGNGWTLEAAEHLCVLAPIGEDEDILQLLMSLVDKSLVIAESGSSGTRFRLLQTIRSYGVDRLIESGDAAEVRSAHRDHYLELSHEATAHMRGIDQKKWLDRLEVEHDNLRVALQWCTEESAPGEKGLVLCSNLYSFWWIRGHWAEGRSWHERMLNLAASSADSSAKGNALMTAGNFALYQGDYATAQSLYEQSLAVRHGLESTADVALTLHSLAHVAQLKGDLLTAKPLYEQSIALKRENSDLQAMTSSMNNLANVLQDLHDFEGSRRLHEEALEVRRRLGATLDIAQTLQNLGCLACEMGEYIRAQGLFGEALALTVELRDVRSVGQLLDGFAEVASYSDQPVAAATLWGASESLRDSIGAPLYELDRERHERMYQRMRDALGEEAFSDAWRVGRAMTLEDASHFAMGLPR